MRTLFVFVVLSLIPLRAAGAQDALEEAKAQYAAAAYEDALTTLARAEPAGANKVELEQYRAFCLIALGRLPDAEQAIASLVAADPTYVPSPSVASPKVLTLVSEMRRKELPTMARRVLDEGRTAFQDKDYPRAQRNFDLLLKLLDDPGLKDRPENDDLRVLAQGFVALVEARNAPAPAPAPARAAAVVPAARRETIVEPPIAVQQALPEWIPPDAVAGSREYRGAVKVIIGSDGRVKSATIEKASYPSYDVRLLQAARTWVYRPATRNGEAVESEKVVQIQLRKRN